MNPFQRRQQIAHMRNRGGITLHPEHGVNPTLGVCLFCGGDTGEIGLLGHNRGKEAPRKAVLGPDPCPKCKEGMSKGITFMEAKADGPGIQVDEYVWLTGSMVVVTEDWCRRALTPSMLDQVLKKRVAYMDPKTFEMFRNIKPTE